MPSQIMQFNTGKFNIFKLKIEAITEKVPYLSDLSELLGNRGRHISESMNSAPQVPCRF